MIEYYNGSDIPFTITGGNRFNLDEDDFEVWHYIYSNKIHKIPKSEMRRISANSYCAIIGREATNIMGEGSVTMELRILDKSHNMVDIIKEEKVFLIKNSLIGRL